MGLVVLYKWDSIMAFDQWHEQAIEENGLPKSGTNAATGETSIDAVITDRLVQPIEYNGFVYAEIDDTSAEFASQLLGSVSNDELPKPVLDWLES